MTVDSDRFPLFDSLRAIAALMVLGAHAVFYAEAPIAELFTRAGPRLEAGVAVFFVISGFLLYRPFVQARLEGRSVDARAYAWRRLLRIVPAYWVILTLAVLWLGLAEVRNLGGVLTYYGFAQIYRPEYFSGGLSQAWTLCVEVTFYAFLPIYALALRRVPATSRRARLRVELGGLGALVAIALAWKLWRLGVAVDPERANATAGLNYLPGYLDHFALGMGLAVGSAALVGRRLPGPLRVIDRAPALAWGGAIGCFLLSAYAIGLDGRGGLLEPMTAGAALGRHYLYALIGLGLVLPAVFGDRDRGMVRRLLGNRALLYVGVVSYGVYLWHLPFYVQLQQWGFLDGGEGVEVVVVWVLVGVAVSVALASATYWAIERPALSLKRLVPPRR